MGLECSFRTDHCAAYVTFDRSIVTYPDISVSMSTSHYELTCSVGGNWFDWIEFWDINHIETLASFERQLHDAALSSGIDTLRAYSPHNHNRELDTRF